MTGEGVSGGGGVAVGEAAGVAAGSGLKASVTGRWRGCESVPAPWRPSARLVCV